MPYQGVHIMITADSAQDDGLRSAADKYVGEHPRLSNYDLKARWTDDRRESVTLTVPVWFLAQECTITAHTASATTTDNPGGIDIPFTISFSGFSLDGKTTFFQDIWGRYRCWSGVDRLTLKLMEELDPEDWGDLNNAIVIAAEPEAERFLASRQIEG